MNTVTEIYADKIVDPVNPMRTELDRDRIHELADSIKSEGLINPITVRPTGDKFEVVAGHRRFRACLIAGVVKIQCIVKELSDDEVADLRAHENIFREDLDPVEEALALGRLVGEDESKIPVVAKRWNKSEQWVSDRLTILTYPDYLVAALKERKISIGVAKWLGRIGDEVYRRMFVERAIHDGMAIWQAEYYWNQWNAGILRPGEAILPPPIEEKPGAKAPARVPCEKCGGVAEHPNLRSVFIHMECPAQETAREAKPQ